LDEEDGGVLGAEGGATSSGDGTALHGGATGGGDGLHADAVDAKGLAGGAAGFALGGEDVEPTGALADANREGTAAALGIIDDNVLGDALPGALLLERRGAFGEFLRKIREEAGGEGETKGLLRIGFDQGLERGGALREDGPGLGTQLADFRRVVGALDGLVELKHAGVQIPDRFARGLGQRALRSKENKER
jgi:hypothetical protein